MLNYFATCIHFPLVFHFTRFHFVNFNFQLRFALDRINNKADIDDNNGRLLLDQGDI